jgi:glutathione S-transferase
MSDATLFSSVRSPHCFKVSIVLEEKRVRFERVEIDLPARQQKTPEYLAIQPRGQVPAYLDDAGAHLDSLDVMLHLEARHPEPRTVPADPAQRDAMLAWSVRSSVMPCRFDITAIALICFSVARRFTEDW